MDTINFKRSTLHGIKPTRAMSKSLDSSYISIHLKIINEKKYEN
jgi:hypothetical protein